MVPGEREKPVDQMAEKRESLKHLKSSDKDIISFHLHLCQLLHLIFQSGGILEYFLPFRILLIAQVLTQ